MTHVRSKLKFFIAFQILTDCQTEVVHESALSSFTSDVHVESYYNLHKEVMDKIVERINLEQVKRAQGRSKKTWMEVMRQDIEAKGLSEDILLDRNEWRKLIHVPDPA